MDVMRHRVWSDLVGCLVVSIVLTACATSPATSMKHKTDPTPANSVIVQSLQRQIKERDKYIAELESRLNALKVIDQDMEKRRNFNRPPATVTPAESPIP
jgi:hypothetical protein